MEHIRLGRHGPTVSRVALGCLAFQRWINEDQSARLIDTALDHGITLFDTANQYGRGVDTGDFNQCGESEATLGRLMKHRRERIVLATKFANPVGPGPNDRGGSRLHIMRAVEDSLRRLKTDRIDIYQMHRPDPATPMEETLAALESLVQQGKILYPACSNHMAWEIAKAHGIAERRGFSPLVSVQPEYNLVSRTVEQELFPFCQREGVAVLVYSALMRGLFSGQYDESAINGTYPEGSRASKGEKRLHQMFTPRCFRVLRAVEAIARDVGRPVAELAFAWTLTHPAVTSVIAGATKPADIEGVVRAAGQGMDDGLRKRITAAAEAAWTNEDERI